MTFARRTKGQEYKLHVHYIHGMIYIFFCTKNKSIILQIFSLQEKTKVSNYIAFLENLSEKGFLRPLIFEIAMAVNKPSN